MRNKKLIDKINKKGFYELAQMTPENQASVAKWAKGIYEQYTLVLEKNPLKIRNINELSVSKQDVKLSIKILIATYYLKGAEKTVNKLRDQYISLGSFQKINHEDKKKITGDGNQFEQELASIYPEYHKYLEIIISEQDALIDDLNIFISDLDTIVA